MMYLLGSELFSEAEATWISNFYASCANRWEFSEKPPSEKARDYVIIRMESMLERIENAKKVSSEHKPQR